MFLCKHNSCRSQMAEGFASQAIKKAKKSAVIEVASAGIECGTKIRPGAVKVMQEIGIDITDQTSDGVDKFKPSEFTHVISMCGCGMSLSGEKSKWKEQQYWDDWNLDDPPKLDKGDFNVYRRVRDECGAKVSELLSSLLGKES
eukprot:g1595.t1